MTSNAKERRSAILKRLKSSDEPVTASQLAEIHHVSRQIIVGDIALLRAEGHSILPTPRGYMFEQSMAYPGKTAVLACRHSPGDTREELYLIVDNGGRVIDVTVEHPVYGELHGNLNVENRYDADRFVENLHENNALTLCSLTGGIHLHTIAYRDAASIARIRQALSDHGYLLQDE